MDTSGERSRQDPPRRGPRDLKATHTVEPCINKVEQGCALATIHLAALRLAATLMVI